MRQGPSVENQSVAHFTTHQAIEQSVPVNMTRFPAVVKKSDAAKSMNLDLHPAPLADGRFDRAYRSQPRWAK